MYVDIHTHNINLDSNLLSIYNATVDNTMELIASYPDLLFSVGVHPWNLDSESFDVENIFKVVTHGKVKMVGECGLDKNIATPIEKQITIFEKHIELSETVRKPLIIHCVKCFNELFDIKKTINPTQRWIVHGFRGKPQLAEQALKLGISLSYGKLFNPQSLLITPIENIFLETDDFKFNITKHYDNIATIKKCNVEQLIQSAKELLNI